MILLPKKRVLLYILLNICNRKSNLEINVQCAFIFIPILKAVTIAFVDRKLIETAAIDHSTSRMFSIAAVFYIYFYFVSGGER